MNDLLLNYRLHSNLRRTASLSKNFEKMFHLYKHKTDFSEPCLDKIFPATISTMFARTLDQIVKKRCQPIYPHFENQKNQTEIFLSKTFQFSRPTPMSRTSVQKSSKPQRTVFSPFRTNITKPFHKTI